MSSVACIEAFLLDFALIVSCSGCLRAFISVKRERFSVEGDVLLLVFSAVLPDCWLLLLVDKSLHFWRTAVLR